MLQELKGIIAQLHQKENVIYTTYEYPIKIAKLQIND